MQEEMFVIGFHPKSCSKMLVLHAKFFFQKENFMRQKRSSQAQNQAIFDFGEPEISQIRAIHYGEAEILPDVRCECYVLEDGQSVMSERGLSSLLGMSRQSLNIMSVNWPQKSLESFCDKAKSMATTFAFVTAEKSPYKNQSIVVYDASIIEEIIRVYALAYSSGALRENQIHIGKRASMLVQILVRTALHIHIEHACGLKVSVQKTVQRY